MVAGPAVFLAFTVGHLEVNDSDIELSKVRCGKPGKKCRELSCLGNTMSCGGSGLQGVLNALKVLCTAALHGFDHCVIRSQ